MKASKKLTLLLSMLLLVALVLGACQQATPEATDEPVATEEPMDDPTEEPMDDPTEEPMDDPTEEPMDDGTLEPPSAGTAAGSLEEKVDNLTRQITELRKQINRYEERKRFHDVLGGIGYIVGLSGLAFYFLGVRRKQRS